MTWNRSSDYYSRPTEHVVIEVVKKRVLKIPAVNIRLLQKIMTHTAVMSGAAQHSSSRLLWSIKRWGCHRTVTIHTVVVGEYILKVRYAHLHTYIFIMLQPQGGALDRVPSPSRAQLTLCKKIKKDIPQCFLHFLNATRELLLLLWTHPRRTKLMTSNNHLPWERCDVGPQWRWVRPG